MLLCVNLRWPAEYHDELVSGLHFYSVFLLNAFRDETCFRLRKAVREGFNPSLTVFRSIQEVLDACY